MIQLSIIIPVFNGGKYIERCIQSILSQDVSLNQYEIIVVNDGSTDDSLIKIQSFAPKIKNFKLISQKNKGVAAVRNAALRSAVGKFIFFVDADDMVNPNTLGTALGAANQNNIDAISFSYNVTKRNNVTLIKRGPFQKESLKGIEWARIYIKESYYLWSFFLKKEIITKNNLWFNERVKVWSDVLFLTQFLCLANSVYYKDHVYYNYYVYEDSLSHRKAYRTPIVRFHILISLIKFYFTRNLDKRQKRYIKNRIYLFSILLTDTLTRYVFTKWLTDERAKINARA